MRPAPELLAHELRQLREDAGAPSYDTIEAWGLQQKPAVNLSKGKLSAWFSGSSVPAHGRPFDTLVELLEGRALRRSGTPKRGVPVWREMRKAADQERRRATSDNLASKGDTPSARDGDEGPPSAARDAGNARHGLLQRLPPPAFTLRRAATWTAQRLGVHAAVSGRPAHLEDDPFVLPTYVMREHDTRVRGYLTEAVDGGESVLVVVRGESCTGKTRTMFEAVQATVPDFDLFFPLARIPSGRRWRREYSARVLCCG
ncbi:hypothetical protein QMZ92_30575 [Streptomyces sp. HNM0645]|uniref:hypothetical protein n=1 Tax=Streptomyces sp. HNM0645 TaxID=2782343 RepID=UPI0024B71B82|nr:hypothetical protein [Streptomyces sp. HNM0645]MDI9888593.1 hypothetical protein [Streptomyces sp. HNM0645]